jgi:3-oxoacyl-[acyl-carrier protein] reductase
VGNRTSDRPNYATNTHKAQEVVTAIEKIGGKALAAQLDVSKLVKIEKLFDRTIESFRKVDILVNNVGIIVYKPIRQVTEAEFEKIFATNVKGTYFASQRAAQRIVDGKQDASSIFPLPPQQ